MIGWLIVAGIGLILLIIGLANKYNWLLHEKLVWYYNNLYSLNYKWLLNGID